MVVLCLAKMSLHLKSTILPSRRAVREIFDRNAGERMSAYFR